MLGVFFVQSIKEFLTKHFWQNFLIPFQRYCCLKLKNLNLCDLFYSSFYGLKLRRTFHRFLWFLDQKACGRQKRHSVHSGFCPDVRAVLYHSTSGLKQKNATFIAHCQLAWVHTQFMKRPECEICGMNKTR